MKYEYRPQGVCAQDLTFEIADDGTVHDIVFFGGCNGNLKAIAKLCEGKQADEIVSILKGNTCGYKKTSCADQLALALEAAKASK